MNFGLALPNSGPLASPANIRRVAEEAEALGFDALLVHDHISYDTEWLGHRTSGLTEPHADISPDLYESLVTLSFAAAAARTVRLMTSVLVLPLRDPRVLARQIITLQALSGHRLSLGIGSGDYPADYRVMEIPYTEKAAYTREYVEALSVLLPGGRADFRGERIQIDRGAFFPETAEIPLLMGGGIRPNPQSGVPELFEPPLRTLARWCHGWIPEGPPAVIREGIALLSRLAAEAGRASTRFEVRAQSPLYIGDDDEARAKVGRNRDYELVGSIERIVSLLVQYRDAGVDAMNLPCFAGDQASCYEMVHRFAREIMPRFAQGRAGLRPPGATASGVECVSPVRCQPVTRASRSPDMHKTAFPAERCSRDELERRMESFRRDDAPWHSGRSFKPSYFAGDDVLDVAHEAFGMYIDENALYSRTSYPSLHRYEVEVVDMLLDLLHAPDGAGGSTTSGGTETNIMAVKTARDWAREREAAPAAPEMIVPRTAHPSFDKAAHLLGVRVVRMAESPGFVADVEAMASAINRNTVMLVASAPPYPYGECDPVGRIAALARQHALWLHVDACLGGMVLPFAREIDSSVPEFDFAIPGVTSISVDLHKYGYATKGVSALLLRDAALERFQRTTFEDWPAGVYSTPNISGSRSGGAIASAWAVMRYLGRDGYREVVGRLMRVRQTLADGIESIEGLSVYAKPHTFQLAFGSDALDIFAVAEGLGERGWLVGRALEPPSIMLMLNMSHEATLDAFLSELREVVDEVRAAGITAAAEPAVYAI